MNMNKYKDMTKEQLLEEIRILKAQEISKDDVSYIVRENLEKLSEDDFFKDCLERYAGMTLDELMKRIGLFDFLTDLFDCQCMKGFEVKLGDYDGECKKYDTCTSCASC